ncbi:MAG: VOC family protein [Pigmentiphaga sp.]
MSTPLSYEKKPFFQPRRLGHVNLWVEDLERSESFYSASCGLVVEFTEPDLIATFLGTGATPHDLGMIQMTGGVDRYGRDGLLQLPGTIGREVGLNHLAWELENEAVLVEAYRHLKQQGIDTDITVDHQVAHSVYMFDPDGNYNEFYCDTVKDWKYVLNGPMELLTSHWDPLEDPPFHEGRYEENPELHTVPEAPVQPHRVTPAVLQPANLDALVDF